MTSSSHEYRAVRLTALFLKQYIVYDTSQSMYTLHQLDIYINLLSDQPVRLRYLLKVKMN